MGPWDAAMVLLSALRDLFSPELPWRDPHTVTEEEKRCPWVKVNQAWLTPDVEAVYYPPGWNWEAIEPGAALEAQIDRELAHGPDLRRSNKERRLKNEHVRHVEDYLRSRGLWYLPEPDLVRTCRHDSDVITWIRHPQPSPADPPTGQQRERSLASFVKTRDQGTCYGCGVTNVELGIPISSMHAHHLVPLSEGGDDAPSNMVTLCPACHQQLWHRWMKDDRAC